MMVKPTVAELKEKVGDNRYSLVIMTAKRARQIASGDPVRTKSKK
jgi:DNA-directed RNA polymerase omega subunit